MSRLNLVLIVHNVRSCHNVGSILRSADAFGVDHVFLSGYTPYPEHVGDSRLPHEIKKITDKIHKTALGAEKSVQWSRSAKIDELLAHLTAKKYQLAALEQTPKAKPLYNFKPTGKLALVVGAEVGGLAPSILKKADIHLEIPMLGKKESLNVSVATAIALYHLRHDA